MLNEENTFFDKCILIFKIVIIIIVILIFTSCRKEQAQSKSVPQTIEGTIIGKESNVPKVGSGKNNDTIVEWKYTIIVEIKGTIIHTISREQYRRYKEGDKIKIIMKEEK